MSAILTSFAGIPVHAHGRKVGWWERVAEKPSVNGLHAMQVQAHEGSQIRNTCSCAIDYCMCMRLFRRPLDHERAETLKESEKPLARLFSKRCVACCLRCRCSGSASILQVVRLKQDRSKLPLGLVLRFHSLSPCNRFSVCSPSGGGANGFSPFDSLADVESYTDDRQLLFPTLNFTCNATIVAWSMAVASTVSEDSPAGSIALQVWRNRSGAEGEPECVEMVQEAIYSQVLGHDERVQLTLRDSRFFLNVSKGDFLGFFVYEEGLSPLYDRDSSNMTVLQSASQEPLYCLINGTVSPAGRPTLNVSPMVTLELASELWCMQPGGSPPGSRHLLQLHSTCSFARWSVRDSPS